MARTPGTDSKSPQALLHVLCSKITGLKDDALSPYFKLALTTLGSTITSPVESTEFEVAEKIKKKLVALKREKDAAKFAELHRKLQAQDLVKNRWSLLYLLHKLGDDRGARGKHGGSRYGYSSHFMPALATHGATSTPAGNQQHTAITTPMYGSTLGSSGMTSGISSIGTGHSSDPSIPHASLPPGALTTPFHSELWTRRTPASKLLKTVERSNRTGYFSKSSNNTTVATAVSRSKTWTDSGEEVSELVLLREIVYVFQGIQGKYLLYDAAHNTYKVDPKAKISKSVRRILAKLMECGWLYTKVRKYADSRSTDRAFGLVGQSFCSALHLELTEYYRLIAVLDAQLQQEEDAGMVDASSSLTLRRLAVWSSDPLVRLKTLAALVDVCQGKKGGSLASVIHSYTQHGDPTIQALVRHTLMLVSQPIFSTILRWIYDGELEDTYHEFFVASDPTVKDERLWHEKYSLRKSMIPSFLQPEMARKILLTGKSINFLRQVCQDRATMRNREVVKKSQTTQVESIFSSSLDGVFSAMIDTVYRETSTHLLDILQNKYKFMEHLTAMRRYLLLGQGDFIRHLMDLLEEDLAKPAGTLFLHNLTGILETAIRATNAQYDDQDILKRLDVRLLEVSPGDTGWDVFSLHYHVDGPIRTVFSPEAMISYLRVFNFLWRAKRMEYILSSIWKDQMQDSRLVLVIRELHSPLHVCHAISGEMVHFVQQVQYYVNYEVLESSWTDFLKIIGEAEDLDVIIAAHDDFLERVTVRSLLDPLSTNILRQLRTIYDLIVKFQSIQSAFYLAANDEVDARARYKKDISERQKQGEWGLTDNDEQAEEARRSHFCSTYIPKINSQLRLLHESYLSQVCQFLLMLTSHNDVSLRFLSFRLDFNEHYRKKNPDVLSPATWSKAKRRTQPLAVAT